jgi:hypothetical protein
MDHMKHRTNPVAHALHDVGLAAWFGGSLMGAVGLNGASEEVADPKDRVRVANAGWGRWTPVNLAAIGAHLLGSLQLLQANKARMVSQQGVARDAAVKAGLTLGAAGATFYARVLGQKLMEAEADAAEHTPPETGVEAESGVSPSQRTPEEVAKAQRQLRLVQWVIPLLTGGIVVMSARMSEQQRLPAVAQGIASRLRPGRAA